MDSTLICLMRGPYGFAWGKQYLSNQFGVHVCPRFVIGYVLGRYT